MSMRTRKANRSVLYDAAEDSLPASLGNVVKLEQDEVLQA